MWMQAAACAVRSHSKFGANNLIDPCLAGLGKLNPDDDVETTDSVSIALRTNPRIASSQVIRSI